MSKRTGRFSIQDTQAMKDSDFKAAWKREEAFAFQGWDFSHLDGRWDSEALPWDYREIVLSLLKSTDELLDLGTGGGEFLLSLGHPFARTSVTEAFPPNAALCRQTLEPLGITVAQTCGDAPLPFESSRFDMVINRHEAFDPAEVWRVLKKGGTFITQQVGGRNDVELSQRLIQDFTPPFPLHTLENNLTALRKCGFEILKSGEAFTPIRFFDVGALVYFAKIIEWEFPGFSVDSALDRLWACQKEIQQNGCIQGTEHRFLIVSKKA